VIASIIRYLFPTSMTCKEEGLGYDISLYAPCHIDPDRVVSPFAFVTQLRPRLGTRVLDLPVRNLARNYFYKWLTVFDAHGSETGGGRQKTAKISFDCRPKN
jgi:hypothetical protein